MAQFCWDLDVFFCCEQKWREGEKAGFFLHEELAIFSFCWLDVFFFCHCFLETRYFLVKVDT